MSDMGEIADALIEEGMDWKADHDAGHPHLPPEDCPFCHEEDEDDERT